MKKTLTIALTLTLTGCNFDPTRFREPNPALLQQGLQMLHQSTRPVPPRQPLNCTSRNVYGTVQTHCY